MKEKIEGLRAGGGSHQSGRGGYITGKVSSNLFSSFNKSADLLHPIQEEEETKASADPEEVALRIHQPSKNKPKVYNKLKVGITHE